jgi:hypothetical protein
VYSEGKEKVKKLRRTGQRIGGKLGNSGFSEPADGMALQRIKSPLFMCRAYDACLKIKEDEEDCVT